MARKPTKAVAGTASRSSSKRAAPDNPRRQSKRAKPRQSYIEADSDDPMHHESAEGSESKDAEVSDYDVAGGNHLSSDSEADEPSEVEDIPKKSAQRGRPSKRTDFALYKKQSSEEELWKPGAKLEPGTQVIIKKPKAREAGTTPYADNTIHPNTMFFLRDLAAHNDRNWLRMHDPDYRQALHDFNTFVEKLSERVIEADDTIPELPVKDIVFRIYRDVRFSKDQTPYKTHFSAAWSRTGRKGPYAAYYVQIQPDGGSFVGGGLWQPEANALSALRRDIALKGHKIKRVLTDSGIRKAFLDGVANDERAAVKAFVGLRSNRESALKKQPKGYDKDHKDIELLRLRSFTLGTKLSDEEVVGAMGLDRIMELITCMVPFIRYLNGVVMPDESSDSSEDDEQGDNSGDDSAGVRENDD